MLKHLLLAALISTALSSHSLAGSNGPIKHITLSSGGVAEVTRKAKVGAEGVVEIEVPLEQVDDILKSILINDQKGKINEITLAGPEPVAEIFRSLPFTPKDLKSLPTLLSSLQGTDISINSSGREITGKILGVENRKTENDSEKAIISLLKEDGSIVAAVIGDDASLVIHNEQIRNKVINAIGVAGRGKSDGSRTIQMSLSGEPNRPIDLSYVIPAPIWKTSYRIVLKEGQEARLQAWAVFENATGEDWEDVSIKLSSGDPVTLQQSLHQRFWKERGVVEIDTSARPAPATDMGGIAMKSMSFASAPSAAPMAEASVAYDAAQDRYNMATAHSPAHTAENDIATSFDLQGEFNVRNGDTVSTPILDVNIKAERVSVYQAYQKSKHPVAAVMLENTSGASLPKGILTVYDDRMGYVGDAQVENLPADESRYASFATDLKVSVLPEHNNASNITSIKVVGGVLRATSRIQNSTIYNVTGANDTDRTVIIEHPKKPGWKFAADDLESETSTHYRLKITAPVGKTVSTVATEEFVNEETYRTADGDTSLLMHWASTSIDTETASKLKKLADARSKQAQAERDAYHLHELLEQADTKQERIRKNLAAVPAQSDAHANYMADLKEVDDQIKQLETSRGELVSRAISLGKAVDQAMSEF